MRDKTTTQPQNGGRERNLTPYYYILVGIYRWLEDKPLTDFYRPYNLELVDCSRLRESIGKAREGFHGIQIDSLLN